jgi:type IV secretory pathway VirB10-like protein
MSQSLYVSAMALVTALAVAPIAAEHPTSATYRDIQDLQYDLENLDASLRDLDSRETSSFQQRAEQIREDVTRLEAQLRRHLQDPDRGLGATQDEVANLRRSIAALQADISETPARRPRSAGTLPEGTSFEVRLDEALSSKTARREDRFFASIATPVRVDGRVVLPAGTRVRGIVDDVQEAERPARSGRLDLVFDRIAFADGAEILLHSRVVSIEESLDAGDTAKKAGIGAILGGVLGSIIGGKKGALAGIVIGGAGGVVGTSGQEVTLPVGTTLSLRLEKQVVVVARR